jgi:broad specificity phosphatase PhoE
MKLLVVRHGQSLANTQGLCATPDSPLTELGIEQAKQAAAQLKAANFDALWSSPVFRAQQTAEIIRDMAAPQLSVVTNAHFAEIDTGEAAGKPTRDYFAKLKSGEPIPGAETPEALFERVQAGLAELKAQAGTVVLVTHAVTYQMMMAVQYGWPAARFIEVPEPANGEVKELAL